MICIVWAWLIFRNNEGLQLIFLDEQKEHYRHNNIPKERYNSKYQNHYYHYCWLWFVVKIFLLWEILLVCCESFVHNTNNQYITNELNKSAHSSSNYNHHHSKVWNWLIRCWIIFIVSWFIYVVNDQIKSSKTPCNENFIVLFFVDNNILFTFCLELGYHFPLNCFSSIWESSKISYFICSYLIKNWWHFYNKVIKYNQYIYLTILIDWSSRVH